MYQKTQLIKLEILLMIFLIKEIKMIKEKYILLCLARRFGGINTIGFTHTLGVSEEKSHTFC